MAHGAPGEPGADVAATPRFPMLQGLLDTNTMSGPIGDEIRQLGTERAALLGALELAVAAFEYQVQVCHAREAAFRDTRISARPMDYAEVTANMYAATAGPLAKSRAAIEAAS